MTSWSCQGDKCVLVNNSNISNNINNINNNSFNRFKTNNSVKGKPESISKNMLSNMFWKKIETLVTKLMDRVKLLKIKPIIILIMK